MSQRTAANNVRLGAFVLTGLACLIMLLFLLGRKQNMFGDTLEIQADFRTVNGLLTGNNVRFAGIMVGTVEHIDIVGDTTVRVRMSLRREVQPFIKKNAIASIGTDGLMGNTVVNITAEPEPAPPVTDGDQLRARQPVRIEAMLNTLQRTNRNLVGITEDMKEVTSKLNNSSAMWELIGDKKVTNSLRRTVQNIEGTTTRLDAASHDVRNMARDARRGRGVVGYLFTDTSFAGQMQQTMRRTSRLSATADTMTSTLNSITRKVQAGQGPLGTLLVDTAMASRLEQSMGNVEQGTARFNESMEALQHNFLLKGYFKRQQKKKARAEQQEALQETK
ncbi:MlaD family protein [Hymenobacter sp. BT730]|uniref:MlaD family protein n=1 Tax=Hymenobacter sp. BT730 TaxID=3063332 RepID=UPI0026DF3A2B|nr:MlaD family protein [Hymenobacter sp. BT730]